MATGKRYYWIKLKESFMTSDAVDFLMGQPNGAYYVVLYQMLLLKTINTGGKFERHIGEVIIPYDEAKIQRDTKWFTIDTIRVALSLYKSLGLIYEDKNGTLALTEYENLVGSETDYAAKNRKIRSRQSNSELLLTGHNVSSDVSSNVSENVSTDIDIDNRDKDIEIRDRGTEIDKDKTTGKEEVVKGTVSTETVCRADVRRVVEAWNSLGLQTIRKIQPDSQRGNMLRRRLRDYGIDEVLAAIENVRSSDFLTGKNNTGWTITFDWFIKPNNFPKVLDGNYSNRQQQSPPASRKRVMTFMDLEDHQDG